MKRTCTLAMALLIAALLLLSGCANGTATPAPTQAPTASSAQSSAPAATPVPAAPDKINLWAPGDGGTVKDWSQNAILKAVDQATNTDITITWDDWSSHQDKLNTAAASNGFPDIACTVDHTLKTTLQTWVDGNVIAPVEGDVAAAAPNWVAEYDQNPTLVELKFNNKIYLQPVNWGNGNDPNMGLIHVRKDLMDKYGIASIDTWDQYVAFLKKAVADGYVGVTSDGVTSTMLNCILGSQNIPYTGWVKKNGGFEFWAVQSGVENAIVTVRQLFTQNLVDPGIWAQKKGRDMYVAGKAASYIFNGGGHIGRMQNDMTLANASFKEMMLPALDFGTGTRGYTQEPMFWAGTMVGAQAGDHPVAAARVINYLISDEGNKLTAIGIEGRDYQMDGNNIKLLDARTDDGFTTTGNAGANPLASGIVNWQMQSWQDFTLLYGKDQAYQDWYAAMRKNQVQYQIPSYGISASSPLWAAFQATSTDLINRALSDAIQAKSDDAAKAVWEKFISDWNSQGGKDATTEMSALLSTLYK